MNTAMARRITRKYMKQGATTGGDLQWAVDQLEAVDSILEDIVDTFAARRSEDPPYEGFESMEDAYKEVAAAAKDIRGSISKDVQKHIVALKRLISTSRIGATKAKDKLDPSTRSKINRELNRAGLDGNRPFDKAQQGYSEAVEVLRTFGIELDDYINSMLFTRTEGRTTMRLAFSNSEDSFSPIPILNTMLVFAFYQKESGRFEVTAYVS